MSEKAKLGYFKVKGLWWTAKAAVILDQSRVKPGQHIGHDDEPVAPRPSRSSRRAVLIG